MCVYISKTNSTEPNEVRGTFLKSKVYKSPSFPNFLFKNYFSPAPKEKPCCTLPTVKKLLEQKRKRETFTAQPSCSTVSISPPVPTASTAVRQHTQQLRVTVHLT